MSRTTKWLIITFILVLIIALFRAKAIAPAGILSGLLGFAAVAERFLRLRTLYKAGQGQPPATRQQEMSLKEALELLELPENPTKAQVNTAYKRLIEKNHPDKGGSKVLAAQVNKARDVVMKSLSS